MPLRLLNHDNDNNISTRKKSIVSCGFMYMYYIVQLLNLHFSLSICMVGRIDIDYTE